MNMSYCRFQNTLVDLRDCLAAMQEEDMSELSKEEKRAKDQLVEVCRDIIDESEGSCYDESDVEDMR